MAPVDGLEAEAEVLPGVDRAGRREEVGLFFSFIFFSFLSFLFWRRTGTSRVAAAIAAIPPPRLWPAALLPASEGARGPVTTRVSSGLSCRSFFPSATLLPLCCHPYFCFAAVHRMIPALPFSLGRTWGSKTRAARFGRHFSTTTWMNFRGSTPRTFTWRTTRVTCATL